MSARSMVARAALVFYISYKHNEACTVHRRRLMSCAGGAAHNSRCAPSASLQETNILLSASVQRGQIPAERFRAASGLTEPLARQAEAGRRPAAAARQARVGGGGGGGAGRRRGDERGRRGAGRHGRRAVQLRRRGGRRRRRRLLRRPLALCPCAPAWPPFIQQSTCNLWLLIHKCISVQPLPERYVLTVQHSHWATWCAFCAAAIR